jgi:hypothetical protein
MLHASTRTTGRPLALVKAEIEFVLLVFALIFVLDLMK